MRREVGSALCCHNLDVDYVIRAIIGADLIGDCADFDDGRCAQHNHVHPHRRRPGHGHPARCASDVEPYSYSIVRRDHRDLDHGNVGLGRLGDLATKHNRRRGRGE